MIRKYIIAILLSPISLLYGIGVGIRNVLYNKKLIKSVRFDVPVVSVGNMSMGGTGKSPHVEYIISFLREYIDVGSLSRGYKRRSHGMKFVQRNHSVEDVGDEALQVKLKYPDTVVAVSEKRAIGIPEMLSHYPSLKCIILDDAFQHRAVLPGLNILLTTYQKPFYEDYLLPSGTLREWRDAYRRAHIIIMTKCPINMSMEERNRRLEHIQPFPNQKVYFTHYEYGKAYYLLNNKYKLEWVPDISAILLCGIAQPQYLEEFLLDHVGALHTMDFPDHYYYKDEDIDRLVQRYHHLPDQKRAVITTEKDAVRLIRYRERFLEEKIAIFVLPVRVRFLFGDADSFRNDIKTFLLNFTL